MWPSCRNINWCECMWVEYIFVLCTYSLWFHFHFLVAGTYFTQGRRSAQGKMRLNFKNNAMIIYSTYYKNARPIVYHYIAGPWAIAPTHEPSLILPAYSGGRRGFSVVRSLRALFSVSRHSNTPIRKFGERGKNTRNKLHIKIVYRILTLCSSTGSALHGVPAAAAAAAADHLSWILCLPKSRM